MSACPDEVEFARAISEGADRALSDHLVACARCREAWEGETRAIELLRRAPVQQPAADLREEMRTAILARASQVLAPAPAPAASRAGRTRWTWVGASALAAAAAVVLVARSREVGAPPPVVQPSTHAHGAVSPHGGARYVASAVSPDEVVTLHDGVIDVEVTPLHGGERFRVITADAEVEVRGTAFEVTAELGHLAGVRVRHGRVEVRPQGRPVVLVGAGETWEAAPARAVEEIAAPISVAPRQAPELAPAPAPRPVRPVGPPRAALTARAVAPSLPVTAAPPVSDRAPQAVAYDEAWAAMRAGSFDRAATAFARAGILDPEGPLAEDAGYWYAVALARQHRAEATTAFREQLARYPHSAHAGEASAMLGWLLVDAHQREEAEQRFRAALGDPSTSVRTSARAGLTALDVP